ncbi:MAG: hypothetical protein R2697_20465 [Ilumatobacteraceae bacterium]
MRAALTMPLAEMPVASWRSAIVPDSPKRSTPSAHCGTPSADLIHARLWLAAPHADDWTATLGRRDQPGNWLGTRTTRADRIVSA